MVLQLCEDEVLVVLVRVRSSPLFRASGVLYLGSTVADQIL